MLRKSSDDIKKDDKKQIQEANTSSSRKPYTEFDRFFNMRPYRKHEEQKRQAYERERNERFRNSMPD